MSAAAVSRGGDCYPAGTIETQLGQLMGIWRFACRNLNGRLIFALQRHAGLPGEAECTQDSCRDNTALPTAGEQVPGSLQLSYPDDFKRHCHHLYTHPLCLCKWLNSQRHKGSELHHCSHSNMGLLNSTSLSAPKPVRAATRASHMG